MMSFLKYVIYALLIVVLYLVGKGFYNENFESSTTVEEMGTQMATEGENTVSSATNMVEKATD